MMKTPSQETPGIKYSSERDESVSKETQEMLESKIRSLWRQREEARGRIVEIHDKLRDPHVGKIEKALLGRELRLLAEQPPKLLREIMDKAKYLGYSGLRETRDAVERIIGEKIK